jgi:ABC-type Na+ efflux pump permease subunit
MTPLEPFDYAVVALVFFLPAMYVLIRMAMERRNRTAVAPRHVYGVFRV